MVKGEMTGTKTTTKVAARKLLSENNGHISQKLLLIKVQALNKR